MPTLRECLHMLGSEKAWTRYDGAEYLRLARETSPEVIRALQRALDGDVAEVRDRAEAALNADVHRQLLIELGQAESTVEDRKLTELHRIVMATTPTVEGHRVAEYLGVISAEAVVGTGPMTEMAAQVADLFGTRSGRMESKINSGTEAAINKLQKIAFGLYADAVLAIDLDFDVLSNKMIMVVASGTAVKLEKLPSSVVVPGSLPVNAS